MYTFYVNEKVIIPKRISLQEDDFVIRVMVDTCCVLYLDKSTGQWYRNNKVPTSVGCIMDPCQDRVSVLP